MIDQLIMRYGIEKINSMTKYPSILTYHNLGDRGSLLDTLVDDKDFSAFEDVYVTEKIDGTNTRIIFSEGDYIIGSRDDFLHAKGDRIINPTMSIVETVSPIAERIKDSIYTDTGIFVVYGEVYGGNVGQNNKQYTCDRAKIGFRMFDVTYISNRDAVSVLGMDIERIASWRDHGGQNFKAASDIIEYSERLNVQSVPYVEIINGNTIPKSLSETYKWLTKYESTNAVICGDPGKAEGVVLRSADRSLIRKVRFEDYERTKKRGLF